MNKLWVLIRKEYKGAVGTKGFLIGTLLTPIIMGAFIFLPGILASRGDSGGSSIAILEVDSNRLQPIIDVIAQDTLDDGTPRWEVEYHSLAADDTARIIARWTAECLDDELDAFLIADETIWTGTEVGYYAVNVSRLTLYRELRSLLTDFVVAHRLEAAGVDPARAESLTARVELDANKIGEKGKSKVGFLSDYFAGLMFVMILFMVIFGYGNVLARSVIEERNSRIIEVLVSSVTPGQIMMSKIIGLGAAALSQVALWVVLGSVFSFGGLGTQYIGGLTSAFTMSFAIWFAVFLLLGFFLFSCWFAFVGAVAPSDQDAQQMISPVTFIMMMPIIIEFAIINDPGATWVRALSMIPPFSPSIMVMRMTFSPVPIWEPIVSALILIVTIAGAIWFASRVFRVGILMTGKRPTLPEIMKWVRY
jgi:ABC-2 type transport system permease protein